MLLGAPCDRTDCNDGHTEPWIGFQVHLDERRKVGVGIEVLDSVENVTGVKQGCEPVLYLPEPSPVDIAAVTIQQTTDREGGVGPRIVGPSKPRRPDH